MKNRYTDKDLSRFFINFKSMPDTIELSNIIQIINNPASHTKIEKGLSNTLNLKYLFLTVAGFGLIATMVIFLKSSSKYLPDNTIHSSTVIDSTDGHTTKTEIAVAPDTVVSESKTSNTKEDSDKTVTEIIPEKNIKQDSIKLLVSEDVEVLICDDYSEIDTSLNYFKLNDTKYEIKSCSQFKDADWKYEWDVNYKDTVWIHLNFISEEKISYGSYELSLLQIGKMPWFSFYGALYNKNKKIKITGGSVCIEHEDSLDRIMFKLKTVDGDAISGHYKGRLRYTAPE